MVVQLPRFSHATGSFALARLATATKREHRQIQQRCLAATAQADARRRRLINAAATAFIAFAFVLTGYALHQEQQIQRIEQRR
jgi:hypothetical protein